MVSSRRCCRSRFMHLIGYPSASLFQAQPILHLQTSLNLTRASLFPNPVCSSEETQHRPATRFGRGRGRLQATAEALSAGVSSIDLLFADDLFGGSRRRAFVVRTQSCHEDLWWSQARDRIPASTPWTCNLPFRQTGDGAVTWQIRPSTS